MRVRTFIVLALVVFAFAGRPTSQAPQDANAPRGKVKAGEILVRFKPGANANDKADAHRQGGGARRAGVARTNIEIVRVPNGQEAASLARYRKNPNVLYAEPNFIRSIPKLLSHSGSPVVPSDFHFEEQWALHNTGQFFQCIPWPFPPPDELCGYVGTPDADIDAPEAWAISTGAGSEIKVAVIDSGIDHLHPDLVDAYIGGKDFVSDDDDPMDDHGHGTHVAGTIAAALNNPTGNPAEEEGVVGVAPNARLLAYKVCDAAGDCDDGRIVLAIAQAIDDGAKVINISLGDVVESQALNDEIQDAWNANIVIVAGAGNEGNTNHFFPAAFPNVVSVAAFDEDHRRTNFTTYGNWVDLSAPGNAILSTFPMFGCGGAGTTPGDTGCYDWNTGTSMATPHVSGAAALIWSRSDVTTNAQVVEILEQSAQAQGVAPEPLNSWTIHGGLNLHEAMSYGAPTNQAPVANAGSDQTVTDNNGNGTESVTLNGSGSSDPDGNIVSYVWREGATTVGSGATATVPLAVGTHTLTLTVTDDDNESDTDDVVVNVQPPPNQPPVANAGPNQTVTDTNGNSTESVTLNGSGSSDPDGNIVSYVWREGATTVGSGATPTVVLAVGAHTLILTVTDDDGATGTDNVVITVQSAPPPADTVAITKATYNSRNRQLVVEATSTGAPGVSLTAYNMSTGSPVPLGPLAYDAKKTKYSATFTTPSKPSSIRVSSSGGGSATSSVGGK